MIYYRYEDPMIYGDEYSARIELKLSTYEVLKITPCGVWIKYPERNKLGYKEDVCIGYIEGKKFILERSLWYKTVTKKRFAWPTKEEALESYKHRKLYQINILEGQLNRAKENLEIAEGAQSESI
jgi:hypothetical protein